MNMMRLTLQERSQRLNAKLRDHATRSLEKIIAASATTPSMRRAATLRLSRLRAATKPAPAIKAAPATTRTKAPAPAPTADAVFEAVQAFRALSAQRSALMRKRKSNGEREILHTMIALMPATIPQGSDPTAWRNFVGQIDGLLSEIKSIKTV
jgi:hypothetical protein